MTGFVYPFPDENDLSVAESLVETIDPGQRAVFTFEPTQDTGEVYVPTIPVSKHPDCRYVVEMDGQVVYGPAPVPPTDVDDATTVFLPSKSFGEECVIRVSNLSSNKTRRIVAQVFGHEANDG